MTFQPRGTTTAGLGSLQPGEYLFLANQCAIATRLARLMMSLYTRPMRFHESSLTTISNQSCGQDCVRSSSNWLIPTVVRVVTVVPVSLVSVPVVTIAEGFRA